MNLEKWHRSDDIINGNDREICVFKGIIKFSIIRKMYIKTRIPKLVIFAMMNFEVDYTKIFITFNHRNDIDLVMSLMRSSHNIRLNKR